MLAKDTDTISFRISIRLLKLCFENQNKTYGDQSYQKAFSQTWVKLYNFLGQITPDNKQRFNTHSVPLARAWANESRCHRNQNVLFRSA